VNQTALQEAYISLVRHELAGAGGAALSLEDESRLRKTARNAGLSIDPVTGLIKRRLLALLTQSLLHPSSGEGSNEEPVSLRNTRQSLRLHQNEIEALVSSLGATVGRIEALFGQVHDLILSSSTN